ncbi:MAG: hypothetical protein ABEJ95_06915 [Candidatus Nanohalobium sp.]
MITNEQTIRSTFETLALTPFERPELLPTVLPLIVGALVIEIYFGKYSKEELGWNTSVGNAIIWTTTGLTMLLTTHMTPQERYAAYFLIGVGAFLGYMNFYHRWPDTVAFIVSSSGVVYTLAYISIILVKTSTPVNTTTVKASLLFFVVTNIGFRVLKGMETPRDRFAYQ